MSMPDFEDVKTFAAFGGLLLGAANLAITVYEKFFKKGTITIEVERSFAKLLGKGWYAVEVDVTFKSLRTKNWIKEVRIEHSDNVIRQRGKEVTGFGTTPRLSFHVAIPQLKEDLLELGGSEFIARLEELQSEGVTLKNLALEEGEQRSLRMLGDLETERLPGEILELPLSGWKLVVDLGNETVSAPIAFEPHHSSPKELMPQQSQLVGFRLRG